MEFTDSPSLSSGSGDELSDSSANLSASFIDAENYITIKEGCQSAFTVEELTVAVNRCKDLIYKFDECSEERKWLVRRLVELRHRLVETKEAIESVPHLPISETAEAVVRLGHNFRLVYQPVPTDKRNKYCDACCGNIWNVIQSFYLCSDCRFKCHEKCLGLIHRTCPLLILSEHPGYEMTICPEEGLDIQGYKCFECKTDITFTFSKGYVGNPFSTSNTQAEARRCDYSGKYFCPSCHWNSMSVIPARVIHNWDFKRYSVSRAAHQLIKMTSSRPLITLDDKMYAFVEELPLIKKLRGEIVVMKQYLAACRFASESGLREKELEWRRHLVHSTETFSLNDLTEIDNGTLVNKIKAIHSSLKTHIKIDCKLCRGRGFTCEHCREDEEANRDIIYPFDPNVYVCSKCGNVQHLQCWSKYKTCQKCLRTKLRS